MIDKDYFPYDHYHTVDWMLGKIQEIGTASFDNYLVSAVKEFADKNTFTIGILGAGYMSDKLLNVFKESCSSDLNVKWVLQRKKVNEITVPVPIITKDDEMAKVDIIINAELVHPDWAYKYRKDGEHMVDLEKIIRRAENIAHDSKEE